MKERFVLRHLKRGTGEKIDVVDGKIEWGGRRFRQRDHPRRAGGLRQQDHPRGLRPCANRPVCGRSGDTGAYRAGRHPNGGGGGNPPGDGAILPGDVER